MNTSGNNTDTDGDGTLESLLRKASPRPVPPVQHERAMRKVVRAEWQAIAGRRLIRRRIGRMAIAASILIVVFTTLNALRIPNVATIEVATIDKSFGSIYLLADRSELQQASDLLTLTAGQTVVTGEDAGIGLALATGGSLRIDRKTRVEFLSTYAIYLQSGRVYLDSRPSDLAVGDSYGMTEKFEIRTKHGVVKHLGTQFMTYSDDDRLAVSVREGQVEVDGKYFAELVSEGQQAIMIGSRRPSVVQIAGYGEAWHWTEKTAPVANVDGRSVIDFLSWVSHETGLGLAFDNQMAVRIAQRGVLRGTVDVVPGSALGIWMLGEDLDWRIENGVIHVSETETADNR